MNVTIDLTKGTTTLKSEENDPMFTFAAQNKAANEFMAAKHAGLKLKVVKQGQKYRPFEEDGQEDDAILPSEDPFSLASFTFKAFTTQEDKQKKAKDESTKREEEKIFKPSKQGGKADKKTSLIVDLR